MSVTIAQSIEPSADPRTVNGIERALDVLLLFSRSHEPSLGVTEIGRRLGLSKAVVHRILQAYKAKGYVEVDPTTRRYSLGPNAAFLGLAYLRRLDVGALIAVIGLCAPSVR